jgi:hypothetical protein
VRAVTEPPALFIEELDPGLGQCSGMTPEPDGSGGPYSADMRPPLRLSELDDVTLTAGQGFRAMGKFLGAYFDRTDGRGELRTIVGDVELEGERTSTDPAALSDWADAVRQMLDEDGLAQ